LRVLTGNLDAETVNYALEEVKKPHKAPIGAFIDAILRANKNSLREVMAMSEKTLDEVLEEIGLTSKWEARGDERRNLKTAQKLIKKGWSIEETAELTELDFKTLEPLYHGAHI